jgi:DNA invertase Pin-like site-specific DNA recombinase
MLGVFAEFEMNSRRERQLEGIAKAKAAGVRFNNRILRHVTGLSRSPTFPQTPDE